MKKCKTTLQRRRYAVKLMVKQRGSLTVQQVVSILAESLFLSESTIWKDLASED